jgi:hypothetical protein
MLRKRRRISSTRNTRTLHWSEIVQTILIFNFVASEVHRTTSAVSTDKNNNTRFFPRSIQESPPVFCAIPSYQDASTTALSDRANLYCPSRSEQQQPLSLPKGTPLDEIATLYAPVLYFHPLESYTLTSIDAVLSNHDGQIKFTLDNSIVSDTIDMIKLLNTTRDYNLGLNKEEFFIQHVLSKDFVSGDGYDTTTGQSRATIYYNAFAYDTNVWIFNYWFYYPYSGTTSTGILTTTPSEINIDPTITNWNYTKINETNWYTIKLRPFGEHQGDWQSMSVAICPFSLPENVTATNEVNNQTHPPQFPMAVSYQQHSSREVRDCTIGQCTFYEDTKHPVGFVARDSHATYPISAIHMIFTQWSVNFFLHLRGIFGLDQTNFIHTRSGSNNSIDENIPQYRFFLPNATNVIRHDRPSEVIMNISDVKSYWRGFAGRFGGTELYEDVAYNSTASIPNVIPFPICTNSNGTEVIDCPSEDDDPLFYTVLRMMHVADIGIDRVSDIAQDLYEGLVSFWFAVTCQGSRGPATQPSFTEWVPGINSPIRNSINASVSSQQFCDSLFVPSDSNALSNGVRQVNLKPNIIGISMTMIFLVIVNLTCIMHPKLCVKSIPILRFDPITGVVQPPDHEQKWQIFRPCVVYCMFYLVTMVGAALYTNGYIHLLEILESTFGTELSSVRKLYVEP